MKRVLKGFALALGLIVLLVAALLSYVVLALPRVKPADPALKIEATPVRLARGEYGRCGDCGADIPFDRLKVEPWAERCVPCATQRERPSR